MNVYRRSFSDPLLPRMDTLFHRRTQSIPVQKSIPVRAHARLPFFSRFTICAMLSGFDSILLIANSIGAYFAMSSLSALHIDRALFISPVADMEKLICDMMNRANVTEDELRARGEIPTEFGETLSWDYRCCLRAHPIKWSVPSRILYGEHDNLTSLEKISFFAQRIGAPLTVMNGGEHWFHTEEQMEFAGRRLEESLR